MKIEILKSKTLEKAHLDLSKFEINQSNGRLMDE